MQSSKEQKGEIRKPCSVINAKKQRKTIEREGLQISSRKLEIPKQDRNGMDLTEAEDFKKKWQEYTRTIQKRSS